MGQQVFFPDLVFSLSKKNVSQFLFGSWYHGVHIFCDLQGHHGSAGRSDALTLAYFLEVFLLVQDPEDKLSHDFTANTTDKVFGHSYTGKAMEILQAASLTSTERMQGECVFPSQLSVLHF